MKKIPISIVLTTAVFAVSVINFPCSDGFRLEFVRKAEAIIGMPWTPFSIAGAARRSMYAQAVYNTAAMNAAAVNAAAAHAAAAKAAAAQAAAANAAAAQAAAAAAQRAASQLPIGTMVSNLPPGCNSVVISGVDYFNCGGVFYRAGFQGNNIVYIVSQP